MSTSRYFTVLLRSAVTISLSFLLVFSNPARAAPAKLNIVILEGDGAVNNISQRTARETLVQVEDENHRPVAGAAVVFLLPDNSPGGVWEDGTRTLQVITDSQGRAAAKGLRPSDTSGKFQIQVEATYQGMTASASLTQMNAVITGAAASRRRSAVKWIAILAAGGGAAAAGAVLATRQGGGSTPASPVTTITVWTTRVGAP